MISLLLSLLSVVSGAAKQAWSFVKARALLLWTFLAVVLPKVYQFLREWRLIGLACLGAFAYAVYTVVHNGILSASVAIGGATGLSSLLEETSWASWLVWTGPLQFGALWDQFLSCVSFQISLRTISFAYTKVMWWRHTLTGYLGPRR